MKVFKPTTAAVNNSLRGKALANKYKKNLANVFKSISRLPSQEIKEEMTLDEIKKSYQYLSDIQNKVQLNKSVNGEPTSECIAWYASGGSAALAWTKIVLKSQGYNFEVSTDDADKEDKSSWSKESVIKAVNEELKQVTYVAMQPGVDAHGDFTDVIEIRKAKENFNKSAQRANLFHMMMTDTFEVIESYLAPVDLVIGEHFVQKGTWLMTLQIHDDQLWEMIKSGEINGISIGAVASVEYMDGETE